MKLKNKFLLSTIALASIGAIVPITLTSCSNNAIDNKNDNNKVETKTVDFINDFQKYKKKHWYEFIGGVGEENTEFYNLDLEQLKTKLNVKEVNDSISVEIFTSFIQNAVLRDINTFKWLKPEDIKTDALNNQSIKIKAISIVKPDSGIAPAQVIIEISIDSDSPYVWSDGTKTPIRFRMYTNS